MNSSEQALRTKLGIPATASIVLILEQSAHCDWDWMATFSQYYGDGYCGGGSCVKPVKDTLDQAIGWMTAYHGKAIPYYYAFCEMAYLQRYLADNPSQIEVIRALADVFSISGGGITSADNLLTHGEAFIRNYLLGRHWVRQTLQMTPSSQMWIPDDFGHDAQLPIVLRAMGYTGAGFWRIPAQVGAPNLTCVTPVPTSPGEILTNKVGLDFTWQAADGSTVQAHWLMHTYLEGNCTCQTGGCCFHTDTNNTITWDASAQQAINMLVGENLYACITADPLVPLPRSTPYLFVPVDGDFCTPYPNLPDIVSQWNACNSRNPGNDCPSSPNPPHVPSGVFVVMATFDDFMRLVAASTAGSGTGAPLTTSYANPPSGASLPAFVPNPYYSGCYGSRPVLKALHYGSARTLLLAESMQLVLEYLTAVDVAGRGTAATDARASLQAAWLSLMPSTHHDYITGTAPDSVYEGEQLTDLNQALGNAQALTDASSSTSILGAIAGAIPAGGPDALATVAVFNGVGLARPGLTAADAGSGISLVEMAPGTLPPGLVSATSDGATYTPVQYAADGGALFMASVPSMGYATVELGQSPSSFEPVLSAEPTGDGTFTLMNQFLKATIAAHGITGLYDLTVDPLGKENLLSNNQVSNAIVFYEDSGNIYRFGNELPCGVDDQPSCFRPDATMQLENLQIVLVEDGSPLKSPLRKTVQVTGSLSNHGTTLPYTLEYSLVAGEYFLRMSTSGTAPSGYSVMVAFGFAQPVSELCHGTAYHWDQRGPRTFFDGNPDNDIEPMTFEATHDFVIPLDSQGNRLAALYHASTPGWAIDATGNLLGCILRNTPGLGNAASGTDSNEHTVTYAIRVPLSGGIALQSPAAGGGPGGALGEALQMNSPLLGLVLSTTSSGALPANMSVASTNDPRAVITAAKAGMIHPDNLVLRIYQGTNAPLADLQINLDPRLAALYRQDGVLEVTGQNAMEEPLASQTEADLNIRPASDSFTFTAPFAITTLALGPTEIGKT